MKISKAQTMKTLLLVLLTFTMEMGEQFERFLSIFQRFFSGGSLKCYSDLRGLQWTECSQRKGFRTCFTKFDMGKYLKQKLNPD